ncbi:MAG TPA: cupin domain-containing protein [Microvirga sp.]|nr:cupin domain-containing protein [Microvirga sp.]
MEHLDRRTALIGLAVACTALPGRVAAQTSPADGKEIFPGVRLVDHTTRDSMISAYKTVSMQDVIFQPGAVFPSTTMANDMVCHMLEGELAVTQGGSMEFAARKGDVWSCSKGTTESAKNNGSTAAVMRVINLLTA